MSGHYLGLDEASGPKLMAACCRGPGDTGKRVPGNNVDTLTSSVPRDTLLEILDDTSLTNL